MKFIRTTKIINYIDYKLCKLVIRKKYLKCFNEFIINIKQEVVYPTHDELCIDSTRLLN